MSEADLIIRPASLHDCRLIWRWRNEPADLRNNFNAQRVPWSTHKAWFSAKLSDPRSYIFILEWRKKPVGQLRVEINKRNSGEVHISIDKTMRGRGIARQAISAVADKLLRSGAVKSLSARIKPDNVPSVIAFLKAGFRFRKCTRVKGVACYELAKDDL